ncbi:MAG: AAA family ATPase [Succinivibrionaceae bacterium]|nr:AAA family ATPase [Succinivibrionaceae bacterium]
MQGEFHDCDAFYGRIWQYLKKNVPIGIDNFEKIISNGMVYIDKTEYLEDLLKSGPEISLLPRPRRFGKTLTMSMLSCFLEMNYQNPRDRSRPE